MSKKDPSCVLNSQLWVPTDLVTRKAEKDFTYTFDKVEYQPKVDLPRMCMNCDLWGKKWRPGKTTCESKGYSVDDLCKDFTHKKEPIHIKSTLKTYKHRSDGWSIFSRGDLSKIKKHFASLGIEDQRSAPRLPFKLVCHRDLYPEQEEVAQQWLDHRYGIIKAPTGWGKTVLWAWLVAKLQMKTLLFAQEVRHLMVGLEGLYEHTNIAELEEEAGEHLIGVLEKDWEWRTDSDGTRHRHFLKRPGKTYPIMFATFQSLASKKGKKLRKKIKNDYGLVWHEEGHHSSAKTFYKAARAFNPKYRGGQTATPTRKDKTHVAIYDLIGPVTATGTKEQMTPEVEFHASNILVPDSVFRRQYVMPILVNFLASNAVYQELLYETIISDIEEDRKILVITERKKHALNLQSKLKLEGFGCELMMGGMKLKEQNWYAEKLLSGDISVIIGTSVINENVNIPPWDTIHLPFPNFGKEREEQRVGRIRRYLSGSNKEYLRENGIEWEKPTPRVHVYTWHSSNDMAEKAVNFRKNLYKSWGFEFSAGAEAESKKKRRPKTMKDWLKDCGEDDNDE